MRTFILAVLASIPSACSHRAPTAAALDPETIDLDAVPARAAELDGCDCHVLAQRAHQAVLRLEARAPRTTPEAVLPMYRLHVLATELAECGGYDRPPFFNLVADLPVALHDLRAAQILLATPGLATLAVGPLLDERRGNVRYYVDLIERDPSFGDNDRVLELLREPRIRGRPRHSHPKEGNARVHSR